jgi:hypothetical protein
MSVCVCVSTIETVFRFSFQVFRFLVSPQQRCNQEGLDCIHRCSCGNHHAAGRHSLALGEAKRGPEFYAGYFNLP